MDPDENVINGLLEELVEEEKKLANASSVLTTARAKYDVASRKYAAVRDMVTNYIGKSPYNKDVKWPRKLIQEKPLSGNFRFLHMKVGDAVVAALKEIAEPATLEDIVEKLKSGGIRINDAIITRAVNAALMKTTGVDKTEEGTYKYKEEESNESPL